MIPSWELIRKHSSTEKGSNTEEESHTGAAFLKGTTTKVTDQTWNTRVSIALNSKSDLNGTVVFKIMKQSSISSKRRTLAETTLNLKDLLSSHVADSVAISVPDSKGGTIIAKISCETTSSRMWYSTLGKVKACDPPQGSPETDAFFTELEALISQPAYRTKIQQYLTYKPKVVESLFSFFEAYMTGLSDSLGELSVATPSSRSSRSHSADGSKKDGKRESRKLVKKNEAAVEAIQKRQAAFATFLESLLKDSFTRKPFLDTDYFQKVITWVCTPAQSKLAVAGLHSLKPLFATEPMQEVLGRAGIIHVLIHILDPKSTYGSQAPAEVAAAALQILPYFSNRFHGVFIKAELFECAQNLLTEGSPIAFQRGMELILMVSATRANEIHQRFIPLFATSLGRLAQQIKDTSILLSKIEPVSSQSNIAIQLADAKTLIELGKAQCRFEEFEAPKPAPESLPLLQPTIEDTLPMLPLSAIAMIPQKQVPTKISDPNNLNGYKPPPPAKKQPAAVRNASQIDTLTRSVGRLLENPDADPVEVATLLDEIERLSTDLPEEEEPAKVGTGVISEEKIGVLPRPLSRITLELSPDSIDQQTELEGTLDEIDKLKQKITVPNNTEKPTSTTETSEKTTEGQKTEDGGATTEEKKTSPTDASLDSAGPQAYNITTEATPSDTSGGIPAPDPVPVVDLLADLLLETASQTGVIDRAFGRWGSNTEEKEKQIDDSSSVSSSSSSSDSEGVNTLERNVLRGSQNLGLIMRALETLAENIDAASEATAANDADAAVAVPLVEPTIAPAAPEEDVAAANPTVDVDAAPTATTTERRASAISSDDQNDSTKPSTSASMTSVHSNSSTDTVKSESADDRTALRLRMAELERSVMTPLQPILRLTKGYEADVEKLGLVPILISIMLYCTSSRLKLDVQDLLAQFWAGKPLDPNQHSNYVDAVLSMAVSVCTVKPSILGSPLPSHVSKAIETIGKSGFQPSQRQLLEVARLLKVPAGWYHGLMEPLISAISKWDISRAATLAPPLLNSLSLHHTSSVAMDTVVRACRTVIQPFTSEAAKKESAVLICRLLRDTGMTSRWLSYTTLGNVTIFVPFLEAIWDSKNLRLKYSDLKSHDEFVERLLSADLSSEAEKAAMTWEQPTSAISSATTSSSSDADDPNSFTLLDLLEGSIARWQFNSPSTVRTPNLGSFLVKLAVTHVYNETSASQKKKIIPYLKVSYFPAMIRKDPYITTNLLNSDSIGSSLEPIIDLLAQLPADLMPHLTRAGLGAALLRKTEPQKDLHKTIAAASAEKLMLRLCTEGDFWRWFIHSRASVDVAVTSMTAETALGKVLFQTLTPDLAEFLPPAFFEAILKIIWSNNTSQTAQTAISEKIFQTEILYKYVGLYNSTIQEHFLNLLYADYNRKFRHPQSIRDFALEFLKSDRMVTLTTKGILLRAFTLFRGAVLTEFLDLLLDVDSKQGYRLLRTPVIKKEGALMGLECERLVKNALDATGVSISHPIHWVKAATLGGASPHWSTMPSGTSVAIVAFRGMVPVYGGVIPSLPAISSISPVSNNSQRAIVPLPGTADNYAVWDHSVRIFYEDSVAKPTQSGTVSAKLHPMNVEFGNNMTLHWGNPNASFLTSAPYTYNTSVAFPKTLNTAGITCVNVYHSGLAVSNLAASLLTVLVEKRTAHVKKIVDTLAEILKTPDGSAIVDMVLASLSAACINSELEDAVKGIQMHLCANGYGLSLNWELDIGTQKIAKDEEEEKKPEEEDSSSTSPSPAPLLRLMGENCLTAFSEPRGNIQIAKWYRKTPPRVETGAGGSGDGASSSSAPSNTISSASEPPPPPPIQGKKIMAKKIPTSSSSPTPQNTWLTLPETLRALSSTEANENSLQITHIALSITTEEESAAEKPQSVVVFLSEDPIPVDEILDAFEAFTPESGAGTSPSWPITPVKTVVIPEAADEQTYNPGVITLSTPIRANHLLILGTPKSHTKLKKFIISVIALGTAREASEVSLPKLKYLAPFFQHSSVARATHIQPNEHLQGVIYHIARDFGRRPWTNPAAGAEAPIEVRLSHRLYEPSMDASNIVGRSAEKTFWGPGLPCWFQIDLQNFAARPTHFALRHGFTDSNSYVRNWKLQGSNDAVYWTDLYTCGDQVTHSRAFECVLYEVNCESTEFFRFWKVVTTSTYWMPPGSQCNAFLCCSGFDLFGDVLAL